MFLLSNTSPKTQSLILKILFPNTNEQYITVQATMWKAVYVDQNNPGYLTITLTQAPIAETPDLSAIRASIAEMQQREVAMTRAALAKQRPYVAPPEVLRIEKELEFRRKTTTTVRDTPAQTDADALEYRKCSVCIMRGNDWCYHTASITPLRRPHAPAPASLGRPGPSSLARIQEVDDSPLLPENTRRELAAITAPSKVASSTTSVTKRRREEQEATSRSNLEEETVRRRFSRPCNLGCCP